MSDKPHEIKMIGNTGLCFAESNHFGTVMALNQLSVPVKAHLYMVTLTRKITGCYPVVSTYHCIAQDEENAIAQVKDNAFPELGYVPLATGETIEATAFRIPVQVRGWGRQTF